MGRSKREAAAAAARAEEDAAAATEEAEAHAKERAALDAELRVLRSTLHAARLPSAPRFDEEKVISHCPPCIRTDDGFGRVPWTPIRTRRHYQAVAGYSRFESARR